MRKKIIVTISVFILLVLFLSGLCMPKLKFSERENRYLEEFPKLNWKNLVSGDFTEKLSSYTQDHFAFRDLWITINTGMKKALLEKEINGVYICKDNYLIEVYKGGNFENIAKTVNAFCDKVACEVSFMAVPTSIAINSDKLPKGVDGNKEREDLDFFYSKLACKVIDLQDDFIKENKEKQLFFRTDHHWTLDGALIAYKKFSKNEKLFEIEEVSDSFQGSLFNKIGAGEKDILKAAVIDEDIIFEADGKTYDSIYNEESLEKADKYSYFLYGNHSLAKITNKGKEGKKILVIKDSYANSLIPFMIADYEEIHIIDPRYYGESISDYVKNNIIDEVLFVYNMNGLCSDLGIKKVK